MTKNNFKGNNMKPIILKSTLAREVSFYDKYSSSVPKELYSVKKEAPDLSDVLYPLPSRKKDYTCFAKDGDVLWMGAPNGLTRYDKNAENDTDKVMFFSATRDLPDNDVRAILKAEDGVWVMTATGVVHIVLREISGEEKALRMTEETEKYVSRRGMCTQRSLTVPRELSSVVPYGHSDNSGSFTCAFAVGELCRYAVMKKKYGENDERTIKARASAIRATEACMLLMYIPCRGDGFVARTYLVPTEPVPDDGLFYRITGDKAVCVPTTDSKKKGLAGKEIYAGAEIPKRLSHLYEDLGYTKDGLVYKGDTSSDEITHQYLLMYFFHEIMGEEDKELDEIVCNAAKNTLKHIIDHGFEFHETSTGKPTTWAKWSKSYFSQPLGWSDGCLNATELLMYLKVTMHISGEKGLWEETYNKLVNEEGYARLTSLHNERFFVSSIFEGVEPVEGLMYGDNMLATCSYWLLISLEDNEELKELYKKGYRGWNGTFRREHNPAYDIPFMLSCPEDEIDTDALSDWFRRVGITRLVTSVGVSSRYDVPCRRRFGGEKETSWRIAPDEFPISKYDRNPYAYRDHEGGRDCYQVESAYIYTFAYWLGRYYGLIEEE